MVEAESYNHTFCNRIIHRGHDVCIVQDTCDDCDMDPQRCAINDMLMRDGTLESWETWDLPDFRERERRRKKQCAAESSNGRRRMKNDKIYRQAAIEAVKEASLGETEVPRLTRRILDYLERQEPAEPEPCEDAVSRSEFLRRIEPYNTSDKMDKALYNFAFNKIIDCPSVANLGDYHLFTDDELEAHDQRVRRDFATECCEALKREEKHDTST